MKKYPTQEELRELFDYHPDGYLVWRERKGEKKWNAWNAKFAKKKAGGDKLRSDLSFFYSVAINNSSYSGAKLIWILLKGDVEDDDVVLRKKWMLPTKIENLELSKNRKGMTNKIKTTGGKNKFIGVYRRSENGFFIAEYKSERAYFKHEEEAAIFYDNKSENEKGERPNNTNRMEVKPIDKSYSKYYWSSVRSIEKSGFVGVYRRNSGNFYSRFRKENLGTFSTKEEAARAYNIAAYKHYGENAVLNDIPDPLGSGF